MEAPRPAERAAFLLVEAGEPMIATRPDRPFSQFVGDSGENWSSLAQKRSRREFYDQR